MARKKLIAANWKLSRFAGVSESAAVDERESAGEILSGAKEP